MRRAIRRRWSVLGLSCVVWTPLIVAPSVWASEGLPFGGSGDQGAQEGAAPERDVLAGPSATESDVPGGAGIFSPGMDGRTPGNDRQLERFMQRVLRSMQREDAPASVRLQPEQVEAIQRTMSDHEERVRAYMRPFQEELRTLRAEAGYGADRDREQEVTPEMQTARQRLREINAGQPKTDRVRGEVWVLLTEAQQAHVNAELERMYEERAEEERDAMAPAVQRVPEGTGDARMDELVRRMMALPEAQRERVLTRLLGMMERLEQAAEETRRRAEPPTMDDGSVRVPGEEREPARRRRPTPPSDDS